MSAPVGKNLDEADETRTFDKGRADVVRLDSHKAARLTLEPGWRWSECVKPIVGTDSCQAHHVGYVLSGSLHVVMEDGEEADAEQGLVYEIQPGHDAWVTGDDQFVALEFESTTAETYAKQD